MFDMALCKGYIDAPKSNAGINGLIEFSARRKKQVLQIR